MADRDLRKLERQAASGDSDAQQRLHAARIRRGLPSSYRQTQSGNGRVITNLIGVKVWLKDTEIVGEIVAIYSPDVAITSQTVKTSTFQGATTKVQGELRFLIESDSGHFFECEAEEFFSFKHPDSPGPSQD